MLSRDTTLMDSSSIVDWTILHPNETELLRLLRTKYRFGDVTIIMQDGVPQRVKRVTEIDNLNPKFK